MSKDLQKRLRDLLDWAVTHGCVVSETTGRSRKIRILTSVGIVQTPSNVSDYRAIRNLRSELRRQLRESGFPESILSTMPSA